MTIQPTLERPHPAGPGTQKIYRFDNGFGASVVQFTIGGYGLGSYGVENGRWELAVLRFEDGTDGVGLTPANWELTYETPITDDVVGHLDDAEVEELLGRIRDLPSENPAITTGEEAAR